MSVTSFARKQARDVAMVVCHEHGIVTETPDVTLDQREDGSTQAIGVDFCSGVRIDASGWVACTVGTKNADKARQLAAALLVAAEWIETEASKKIEEWKP